MITHLGKMLLMYDELVATGRAETLSPLDLAQRVLVKGKIKPTKNVKAGRLSRLRSSGRGQLLKVP